MLLKKNLKKVWNINGLFQVFSLRLWLQNYDYLLTNNYCLIIVFFLGFSAAKTLCSGIDTSSCTNTIYREKQLSL